MSKLMLLGGSRYLLPVIESAHKLGAYVITCDYLPDNIAHKFSDQYANVSITDREAVLKAAKELKIDGIMSFATDPGVTTAAYVAEKMGLPSCGSYESVSILQNKGKFRKFLSDNGFNVPHARSYKDTEQAVKDADYFNWPVIVKPVDSAGSKGVTRVDRYDDLKKAISHALDFSIGNEFIIEDFIEKKGCSSDTDCFSIDGELVMATFSSQRFDANSQNPYAPMAYSWPSTFSKENEKLLKSELQRLLKLLGMKTSIYNVETREGTDGKPYIMEVSPRGGGNRLAEMIRFATGMDMIEGAVRAALDMPLNNMFQRDYDGYWAEYVLHSSENGIFEKLWIDPELKTNNVKEIDLWIEKGDFVHTFDSANYAIGTIVLRFDSMHDLESAMECMTDRIQVRLK